MRGMAPRSGHSGSLRRQEGSKRQVASGDEDYSDSRGDDKPYAYQRLRRLKRPQALFPSGPDVEQGARGVDDAGHEEIFEPRRVQQKDRVQHSRGGNDLLSPAFRLVGCRVGFSSDRDLEGVSGDDRGDA